MTLPVSGAISFNNINVELGVAGATTASLGQASYRTLSGVASGAISMSNFYGKANQFSFSIASNTANLDVRAAAVSAGWNGTSKVVCTINSGVYVYSNSTGSYACTISGSFPGGLSLVNNGVIVGRGGDGGQAGRGHADSASYRIYPSGGASGGPAFIVSTAVSVTNNGSINGGGGGGGGGWGGAGGCKGPTTYWSGAGGSGGIGGSSGGGNSGIAINGCGCPGGSGGANGASGTLTAAGGSVLPGNCFFAVGAGAGGAGGGYGAGGGTGVPNGYGDASAGGGAGGAAVVGNGNITWVATGTRNGSIS